MMVEKTPLYHSSYNVTVYSTGMTSFCKMVSFTSLIM